MVHIGEYYLLIGIHNEAFFRGKVDPKTFDEELRRVIGPDAVLEDIRVTVGSGPAGEPPEDYAYFVKTQQNGLRQKLIGIPGVATVFSFETEARTE